MIWAALMMSESLSKRFWNIAVVRLLEKLQCTPAEEKHINQVREQSESSSWCSIHHKVLRSTRRVGRATWTRPHIATSPIRTKHGYGCRCVWCPCLHKMFYSIKLRCSTHTHTVSPALPMCDVRHPASLAVATPTVQTGNLVDCQMQQGKLPQV